jgi:hypothetical protein
LPGRRNRINVALATAAILIPATIALAAGAARAASPDCTFTDTTHSATADSLGNPVLHVTTNDTLSVSCTGLAANASVATSIATPGASLVSGLANQEAFSDISAAAIGAADASGNYTSPPYKVWSKILTNGSACPPTQAQVNAGLACTMAVATLTGSSLGSVSLIYSGQPTPSTPTLTTDKGTYAPGSTVTLSGSGFYGTPVTGAPNSSAGVAAPTLTLDGVALSNALTTTAATWPTAATNSLTEGGILGGKLTVGLPSNISTGSHTLAVVQPDKTAYPGPSGSSAGTVTKSVTFSVGSFRSTLSGSRTSGTVGTVVDLSGANWPPNAKVTVSFTDGAPPSTGTAAVDANGKLTGSIMVTASDKIEASNPIAVTDAADNVTASCAFAVTKAGAGSQRISVVVGPGKLSDTQIAGSSTTVTLAPITLRPTVQNSTGELDALTVTDARGMLTGWTLTGIVTGNFVNVSPYGQHKLNVFPAGDLVISPSVAAVTGLQADVVPGIPQHANHTTGQTLASAGGGGGGGQFQVSAQLHLTVPGRIPAGIYADLLVLTVS